MNHIQYSLIVGLGNPGSAYEKTRHNIGYHIVQAFAHKHGFTFYQAAYCSGNLAEGMLQGEKLMILLPATFMNSAGEAVRLCMEHSQIPIHKLLAVCDDVALPFGSLRMRRKGSAGGHKGLKSIEAHVHSQDYSRLRVGVGGSELKDLSDYVLGEFTSEEKVLIPEILSRAISAVETWVTRSRET